MVLINGQIFSSLIEQGKVYYFKSNQLVATSLSHYFIVIATPSDEVVIFACCTSQFEKRARFIELANIPLSTLVWIKPNEDNGLRKDSFVDCNSYVKYSRAELIHMYENNHIDYVGSISDSKMEEIRQGFIDSPLVTSELKKLL